MAKKTAAEKLAKAERKAAMAQRAVIEARKAALPVVRQSGPPQMPAPGPWEDHLLTGALNGDPQSIDLLRKSGFLAYYTSELRHILETSTLPGYKAWAAKCLDALDPAFDAYEPLPRSHR